MTDIKCVIFDVGGVLLKEKIDVVHDSVNKELGKKVFDRTDALHKKLLVGKISEKDFFKTLSKKYDIPAKTLLVLSDEKYLKIAKINTDSLNVANRLKKNGYKLCILSNVTSLHKNYGHIMELYTNFDHRVLSCDIGAMKPHVKIFRTALKVTGSKPSECIYIEDRKEFLETPKKLGFNVIHFKDAKQLIKDLRKFGVKI
ncbi:MAG TPA: HAD family phosphatase [archaeon]|nr:HAD family phosphatase [archaeon]